MTCTRVHHKLLSRLTRSTRPHRHAPQAERIDPQEATLNPHRKHTCYRRGGIKGALLLWILGVPIPLILLFLLIKGCVS